MLKLKTRAALEKILRLLNAGYECAVREIERLRAALTKENSND
jgi:hypothetical protein